LVNRVVYRHERVVVSKRGKPVTVLVSMADFKMLEEAENRARLERVRELERTTKKYVPFEQVVREYEELWGVDLGLKKKEG
jgi:prevent-host-death family protein